MDDGNGNIICFIPIFTRQTWLTASLQLFGPFILMMLLSLLLGRYGLSRLRAEKELKVPDGLS